MFGLTLQLLGRLSSASDRVELSSVVTTATLVTGSLADKIIFGMVALEHINVTQLSLLPAIRSAYHII